MSGDHRIRSLYINPVIGPREYIDCHSSRIGDFTESIQFVADRPLMEGMATPRRRLPQQKSARPEMTTMPQNVTFYYFTPEGYQKMRELVLYLSAQDRLHHLHVNEDPDNTFYFSLLLLPLSIYWKVSGAVEPYLVEVARGTPEN